MTKALVLLSGGLDSMLAVKILQEQGVEVTGLSFASYFFGTARGRDVAQKLGINFKEINFAPEHLDMVKNPKHGYGKNMNPCIDCHAMMLREAKKIMEEEGYDFVATGEVLGQRPMSQNKKALGIVAKESGLDGYLVRPMSAKLLDESIPEKEGKIIREKLLDIKGRSRTRQKELVKKYGIKEYASPGGGCVLTDPEFGQRLKIMFNNWPDCGGKDVELLKNGRVFWLKSRTGAGKILVVVGRDRQECETLAKLANEKDVIIELADIKGPTTLIRIFNFEFRILNNLFEIEVPEELEINNLKLDEEKDDEEILQIAALLTGYYSTKARGNRVRVKVKSDKVNK